ncbi:hypothetical protein D1007_27247 [Hordeum vulgare]|nr:hypothetical protein D1007_27247 [Hordeum vulgare]
MKAPLDAQEKTLAATEEKKATKLACLPDVELELRMAVRSLCRDGFGGPLATPKDGFASLAKKLVVALEGAAMQVDKILDSECRDLFFAAATRVFSHLHFHEPGFDLDSVIFPVHAEAHDRAAEPVKGSVEALVRRFARVAAPSFPRVAEVDGGEDDASDVDD